MRDSHANDKDRFSFLRLSLMALGLMAGGLFLMMQDGSQAASPQNKKPPRYCREPAASDCRG